MAKLNFKDIHTNLTEYMDARKEYPVVSFENNETVLRQLRGKMFMFAAQKGNDQKGKPQLGIMVLEQKGTTQEPVCVMTSADKSKDRRFRVHFQGKLLLLDNEVNVLLQQLGNRMVAAKLMNNIAGGNPDGTQVEK